MRRSTVILCPLILISLVGNSRSDASALELRIGVRDSIFVVSQDIWVDVRLVNHGPDTVYGCEIYMGGSDFKFDILGNDSYVPEFVGVLVDRIRTLGSVNPLAPNDTLTQQFNLPEWYGAYLGTYAPHCYLPANSYQVTAIFDRTPEIEHTERLVSNTIEILVTDPQGDESKAQELLIAADTNLIGSSKPLALSLYRQLLDRYPSSVYVPRVLKTLLVWDKENRKSWAARLFADHPESGYSDFALTAFLEGTNHEETLQQLIAKYQGTKTAELARKRLLKLRRDRQQKEKIE